MSWSTSVDPAAAKQAVAAALPYYCTPAAVYALPDLPQTGNGKIDKAALLRVTGAEPTGAAAA